MHMPVLKTNRKRVGMTGDIRFRKQWFTGRMILQVAMLYEVIKYRYPHDLTDPNIPSTTEVEWEDADASAALRVSCGLPPFERKRLKAAIIKPSHFPVWADCPGKQEFDPKVFQK
ncbi:hypothetical protein AB6J89_004701 [Salmonella enterica]